MIKRVPSLCVVAHLLITVSVALVEEVPEALLALHVYVPSSSGLIARINNDPFKIIKNSVFFFLNLRENTKVVYCLIL